MAFNIIKVNIYMHVWFRKIQSKAKATTGWGHPRYTCHSQPVTLVEIIYKSI